jgi:hypothetical protein
MNSNQKKINDYAASRGDQRYSVISDLSIAYEGNGQEIHLHTPDISPRGMFVHTALNLPEGAVVRVKFRLRRSNVEVDARSEVRYCLPGVGVGVEFVQISEEAQRAIEEELGIAEEVSE